MQQPRDKGGKFGIKAGELKGDAIALRLPASLDQRVRAAAGWQSKADNDALRAWVELACKERVEGQPSGDSRQETAGYTADQIRVAINRVAMTVQPRDRNKALKLLNAVVGELLANGG